MYQTEPVPKTGSLRNGSAFNLEYSQSSLHEEVISMHPEDVMQGPYI